MIAKLIAFTGLGLFLITATRADADDMEKCQNKLKCRTSSTVSHGAKQLSGSLPPSNSAQPTAASQSGTSGKRR
jgi:hypothetical protein